MPQMLPDQSFYPSPAAAMQAPPETLGYVALLNPDPDGHDALAVVDLDRVSDAYGDVIGRVEMPSTGDELHHFGWNACSSCLCPFAPHPHMERRYLVVPGMRSSRLHILDTKTDPRQPQLVRVIEADEVIGKTGYSRVGDSTNRRGIEIGNWLHDKWVRENEPCRFVILDDSSDMGPLRTNLVRTTWDEGLLPEHIEPALKILRGQ